jgi:hypothetical protein
VCWEPDYRPCEWQSGKELVYILSIFWYLREADFVGGGLFHLSFEGSTTLRVWHGYGWLLLDTHTWELGANNRAKVLKTCPVFRKEACVLATAGVLATEISVFKSNQIIYSRTLERWLEGITRFHTTLPSTPSEFESVNSFQRFSELAPCLSHPQSL